MMNTQELLQILACPRCMGSLEPLPSAEHPEGLACPACNVVYPVRDDIPIMLVDAAVERALDTAEKLAESASAER